MANIFTRAGNKSGMFPETTQLEGKTKHTDSYSLCIQAIRCMCSISRHSHVPELPGTSKHFRRIRKRQTNKITEGFQTRCVSKLWGKKLTHAHWQSVSFFSEEGSREVPNSDKNPKYTSRLTWLKWDHRHPPIQLRSAPGFPHHAFLAAWQRGKVLL